MDGEDEYKSFWVFRLRLSPACNDTVLVYVICASYVRQLVVLSREMGVDKSQTRSNSDKL